jgi:hypothetical protein
VNAADAALGVLIGAGIHAIACMRLARLGGGLDSLDAPDSRFGLARGRVVFHIRLKNLYAIGGE